MVAETCPRCEQDIQLDARLLEVACPCCAFVLVRWRAVEYHEELAIGAHRVQYYVSFRTEGQPECGGHLGKPRPAAVPDNETELAFHYRSRTFVFTRWYEALGRMLTL